MHIGKKVWRSYGDSRSQSSTELNVNKFIIIIKPDRKKTCEIDAGAWMEEENKIILFVYHQDILLYLSMKNEEQCDSTVRSLAYLLNNVTEAFF